MTGARSEVRVDGRRGPVRRTRVAAGRCRPRGRAGPAGRPRRTSRWPAGSPWRRCWGRGPPTPSAGVGPAPLRAGDVLPLGDGAGPPAPLDVAPPPAGAPDRCGCCRDRGRTGWTRRPGGADVRVVRRVAGLRPGRAPARPDPSSSGRDDRELPSEGMVLGAVQVPPDGPAGGVPGRPPVDRRLPGGRGRAPRRPVAVRAAAARATRCASRGPPRAERRVVDREASAPGRPGCPAVSNRTVTTPRPEPHTQPAPSVVVDDVGPGSPGDVPPRGHVRGSSSSASLPSPVSPNRSSWIQSARPDTPTPSSRTPPEVSSSREQAAGEPGDGARAVGGGGQRGRPVERGEVVQPDLEGDRAARQPRSREPLGDRRRPAG